MLSSIGRGKACTPVDLELEGRQLYASASVVELPDKQVPQGWVLVVRDVTDMKRLDAMKTEFVRTVTHNMKSPLTYVRGYASMLHMVGQINSEQSDFVGKIIKGIDDLTQLINELSELGEVSNRVDLTMTPCQLYTIATEVTQSLRSYAEGKGLKLHTDLPVNVPTVVGDPRWLRQAIRNLLDNAIKYTMAPGWVKVSLKDSPTAVVICVADSGIGIAPADRRRIFDELYRVRRKETLHIHGTGLGLSLVKKIAQLHGGQVWVESELGVGSTFYLLIPKERRISDLLEESIALQGASASATSPRPSEDRLELALPEKTVAGKRTSSSIRTPRPEIDVSDLDM
jgi:signal transduction histidine kinase